MKEFKRLSHNFEYLAQVEVCQMLGVSRKTLWKYTKYNGLPVHRPKNARPFYKKSEVIEWMEGQ